MYTTDESKRASSVAFNLQLSICVIMMTAGLITWISIAAADPDTEHSAFLNKLGCRQPKLLISVKNIPQKDDNDDPQLANVYFKMATWREGENSGYVARSLNATSEKFEYTSSNVIVINKRNQRKWVTFEPVDAVFETEFCWFGCNEDKYENWMKMAINLWDADDKRHIFSMDDHVANFYFEYHTEVVQTKSAYWFLSKNKCALSKRDEKQYNRGFYKKGRYEVAMCREHEDWERQLQVRMEFYCEK